MRRSLQAVVAGALGLTAGGSAARADAFDVHGTLVTNIAATDNVFAAGDGGDREADIFVQVRPGVLLAYESPRLIQELTAEVEALDYVRNYDSESFNLHGGYRMKWDPTARSSMVAFASGSTGQLTNLQSNTSPDQTGVAVTPPGKVDVRQADANEGYRYQLTQETSLLQGVFGRYTDANDHITQDVTSYDGGVTLGIERGWQDNSIGLEIGGEILHLRRLGPENGPPGFDREDKELSPHVIANWRHDINRRWSTALNGGLVVVDPYDITFLSSARTREYYPVASATVAYTDDWGRALVTVGRAVSPNLFIAENTVSDSVLAQAAIPLWFSRRRRSDPQYLGAVSIGYSRTQLVDDADSLEVGSLGIYHGDIGVSYAPQPGIAYGVRYEYFRQSSDASAAALSLFGSYSRSTIFATLAVRWPAQLTIAAPRKGGSVRADGSDMVPIGEEVVVPDDDATDRRGQGGGGNQGGAGTGGLSGQGTSNVPGSAGGLSGGGAAGGGPAN